MAIARRLIAQPSSFGQCQATRTGSYFNDKPTTDRRCKHASRFEINGKRYCAKHAGTVALNILCGEEATTCHASE